MWDLSLPATTPSTVNATTALLAICPAGQPPEQASSIIFGLQSHRID